MENWRNGEPEKRRNGEPEKGKKEKKNVQENREI